MSKAKIKVHDKYFHKLISHEEIQVAVKLLAAKIDAKYQGLNPLLVVVLNGAFIFGADLFRAMELDADLCFVKLKSYQGMSSSHDLQVEFAPSMPLKDRHVILIEDIIDTGNTLSKYCKLLETQELASLHIVSLLLKPDAVEYSLPEYTVGIEIENAFVIGYGLDYDDRGRTYKDIYQLSE